MWQITTDYWKWYIVDLCNKPHADAAVMWQCVCVLCVCVCVGEVQAENSTTQRPDNWSIWGCIYFDVFAMYNFI